MVKQVQMWEDKSGKAWRKRTDAERADAKMDLNKRINDLIRQFDCLDSHAEIIADFIFENGDEIAAIFEEFNQTINNITEIEAEEREGAQILPSD